MDDYGFDIGDFDIDFNAPSFDLNSSIDWESPSYGGEPIDWNYSHEGNNYPTEGSTQPGAPGTGGSPINIPSQDSGSFSGLAKLIKEFTRTSRQGGMFDSGIGMLPIILALMSRKYREKESGGGTNIAPTGPRQYNPQVAQGRYGPVMQYAQGGPVRMEDGGFVMTKKAVDGAGGPQGIQKLIPNARMIRGPGHGTSDDVPAVIVGNRGVTPAALSNGEAYVPKRTVENMGGAQRLYTIMNNLQKRG